MTATATIDGTAASTGRLPSVASRGLEFLWPMYLTLVLTLGAWVLVPALVLGWQPVTIVSGSMAPTVQPGHVVMVEPYRGQELTPGALVTYRDAEVDRLVTHRIVLVGDDGTYTTRGDANAVNDRLPLNRDRIVGVGKLVVPAAGLPSLWSHEGRTELLAGVAVLTVLAASAAAGAASEATRSLRRRLWIRPRRSGSVRPVVIGTSVVAIVAVLAATTVSRAAFVGAADNGGNTFAAAALAAPANLRATCGPTGLLERSVNVEWDAVAGSEAYELERSTSLIASFELLTATSATTYEDSVTSSLLSNTEYRVRAVAGSWKSDYTTLSLLCL